MQHLTSATEYQSFIDKFDTFLFDCDGVLWHGDDLEPGAIEVLAYLRRSSESPLSQSVKQELIKAAVPSEKDILFVTNNATKSRAKYKGKFDKLGVQAEVVCPLLETIASGQAKYPLDNLEERDLRIGLCFSGVHRRGAEPSQGREGLRYRRNRD